jgi:F-type H+-transporting ATPase subunit c
MTPELLKQLSFALAIGLGVTGPGLAIGLIGMGAVQGIARNPQAGDKIQSTMILAMAFAESLAIFALVVGMIINFVK